MWQTIVTIVWILGGSFAMWRKQKQNYESTDILDLYTKLTFGVLVIWFIAWLSGVSFRPQWVVMVGSLVGVYWMNKKLWFDGYEWFDVLVGYGLQSWAVLTLVWTGIDRWWEVVWAGVGWLISLIVLKNYRRIRWYKSGKPGLAGLVGVGWWLVGELLVAIFNPNQIYLGSLLPRQIMAGTGVVAVIIFIIIRASLWQKKR